MLERTDPLLADIAAGGPKRAPALLVELLLADQKACWQRGERVTVEAYLQEHSTIVFYEEAVLDLIVQEMVLREARGEAPDLAEYLKRFPHLANVLKLQFEVDRALQDDMRMTGGGTCAEGDATYAGAAAAGAPLAPMLAEFEILELVGKGGMGIVHKARQPLLNRLVALKRIRTGATAEGLARFRVEAEAVAKLQHPNIVQIFEIRELPEQAFLVLEFVEGGSLAQKLADKALPPRGAAQLVEPLARAMHLAHSRNVVHRDLKPANVLLTLDGIPKVTDFGLARQLDMDSGQTEMGAVMGTPSYMSPEQASGQTKNIGPAADVYALGAILYECLTGRPPFKGRSVVETLDMVRGQEPVAPRLLNAKVPRDLDTICLKCLQKEPEKRYGSAEALAEDLRRWQCGEPILVRPISAMERGVKWVRRNPVVSALLTAILLLLSGGSTGIYLKYWDAKRSELTAIQQSAEAKKNAAEAVKQAEIAKENEDKANGAVRDLKYITAMDQTLLAQAAIANGSIALANEWLERVPAGWRYWDWRYLDRQCNGGIFTLYGHSLDVNGVAFSPDGTRLATGSRDRTAIIWDARTGMPLVNLTGHNGDVLSVAFSPDGTRLASGARDHTAKIWDARTGTLLVEFVGHAEFVNSVAFSPDGARLATASDDGTAHVWDARTGTHLMEMKGHSQPVTSVAFSPNGLRLATGSLDKLARIWDSATGMPLVTFAGHSVAVTTVAFSPDGTRLATGSQDRTAIIWAAQTGKPLGKIKGHTRAVTSVVFSPDGTRVLTGSVDRTARIWDVRGGRPLGEFNGHTSSVTSVAFSPDGTCLVTGSADRTATVWDANTGTPVVELKGHAQAVTGVAFSPDGMHAVTSSADQTATVWDACTGVRLLDLKGHRHAVTSVAFSPDGARIVTGSRDKRAIVWDAHTGMALADLKGHTAEVWSVAFSPDGTRVATGSGDRSAQIWDARTGAGVRQLTGHAKGVMGVAFSPDGTRLATANGHTVKIWDSDRGTLVVEFDEHFAHYGDVTSVVFSVDGSRLVTGSMDETARVWDARTGMPLLELKGHTAEVTSVAVSPDGTRLATGSGDGTTKLWDAFTGRRLIELRGPAVSVTGAAFSMDGMRLVTASSDGTSRVWEAPSSKPAVELDGHGSLVLAVTFSPDGTRLLTGSWDKTAKVWDARTGAPLLELKGHAAEVWSVAFSPDGTRLVTGSGDRTARLWDARTGAPVLEFKGHPSEVSSLVFSQDGRRLVTSSWDGTTTVWDAKTGQKVRDEPKVLALPPSPTSLDGRSFAHIIAYMDGGNHLRGSRVRIMDRVLSSAIRDYRWFWTRPRPDLHRKEYVSAMEAKDAFAARFHLDRLLAYEPRQRTALLVERARWQTQELLLQARTAVHSPKVAQAAVGPIAFLAMQWDPQALRLLGGLSVRQGKPIQAISPLILALALRAKERPPVEELMLALAYLDARQPDEAAKWHAQATQWLDRYRPSMQVASTLGALPSGALAGMTELFKPSVDPRYNAFDWETWYECEILRAEVEAKMWN